MIQGYVGVLLDCFMCAKNGRIEQLSQLPGVIEAVTFLSPNWRSLIKGHLTIPKKVRLNHQNHQVFLWGNVANTLIYLICTVIIYNQTNLVYNMKTYWYNPVCNSRSILYDV